MAEEYAQRRGLTLDTTLTLHDTGVSAYRGRNAEYGKLRSFMDAVEVGDVPEGSYLLVENLDRISRRVARRAARVLEDIVDSGITVVTLSDEKEYTKEALDEDPLAFIMVVLMFQRAHDESKQKARRLRDAWKAKRKKVREQGVKFTKKCPSWLKWDEDEGWFVLLEDRVEVVRRIFRETLEGKGQNAIIKALNEEGVPTFGRGKRWYRSFVAKILANPAVAGTLVPHVTEYEDGKKIRKPQDPIPDYYPAAVDMDTFNEVQAMRETRSPKRGRNAGKGTHNIFGGLVMCGLCGGTATYVNKGQRRGSHGRYLVCAEAKAGAGCEYRSVPYYRAEEAFLKAARSWLLENPPTGGDGSLDDQIEQLEATISGGRDRVDSILAEIERGGQSPALRQRLDSIEAELEELEKDRRDLLAKRDRTQPQMVAHRAGLLREALEEEELDRTEVNTLMRRVFKSVTLNRQRGMLSFEWKQGGESEVMFAFPEDSEEEAAA